LERMAAACTVSRRVMDRDGRQTDAD
jgi:hypothetical protein